MNWPLAVGDPVVATLTTSTSPLTDPFAGTSMSCRNCHFVDDVADAQVRTYGDYSRRSRVPEREDGATLTARNSPPLVNAFLDRESFFLHFDGQFATVEDLVRTTFTGRNFGWLPGEEAAAIAQLARVIREDDGKGALALQYGGAYRVVLEGTDSRIPVELRLPAEYRIAIASATDQEIFDGVARLIGAYLRNLTPTLRDLGQSAPYLHSGRKREIEDVLDFNVDVARKSRQGRLRNGASELADTFLGENDIEPLAAFLRALNEDYN